MGVTAFEKPSGYSREHSTFPISQIPVGMDPTVRNREQWGPWWGDNLAKWSEGFDLVPKSNRDQCTVDRGYRLASSMKWLRLVWNRGRSSKIVTAHDFSNLLSVSITREGKHKKRMDWSELETWIPSTLNIMSFVAETKITDSPVQFRWAVLVSRVHQP